MSEPMTEEQWQEIDKVSRAMIKTASKSSLDNRIMLLATIVTLGSIVRYMAEDEERDETEVRVEVLDQIRDLWGLSDGDGDDAKVWPDDEIVGELMEIIETSFEGAHAATIGIGKIAGQLARENASQPEQVGEFLRLLRQAAEKEAAAYEGSKVVPITPHYPN